MRTISACAASAAMVGAQLAPLPALLAPLALAPAAAAERTEQINCYGRGNRPNQCRLPEGTIRVSYLGPDRSMRCREGQTWGQRGDMLWVSGGCGGTFEATVRMDGGWGGGGGGGGGWGGGTGGGGGWGGSGQAFAGEIVCRSVNNRPQTCYANTQGRVQVLQQYSSARCTEGQSWRADARSITVRNGCQARFGFGYGNQGGGWGGNNQQFAGNLECRSENNRYRRCGADTRNRVELVRQFSSTQCVQGRNWGYDRNSIWVDRGCQARFAFGYGNVPADQSGDRDGGGGNAGAIIGGAAIAAGLIALLSQAGKGNRTSAATASAPAAIDADLNRFPADSRSDAQACLTEAARQVGSTGGTRIRLDSVDSVQRSGDGRMVLARLTGSWPDHSQAMAMDCRVSNGRVTAFDVR